MKNIFLFLISILLISCSPKEIPSNKLVERNNIFYEVNSDDPYTGSTYQTHPNGQLKYKSTYMKGKLDGPKEEYHENGQLLSSIFYKENKIVDGVIKYFDKNGNLKKTESYKNGLKNGLAQTYYTDGSIFTKVSYEDGYELPEYISYFSNGQVSIKSHRYSGLYESYFSDGQLELKTTKIGGKNNGVTEEYTFFNKLKTKGTYSSGEIIDGEIRYYDDSGNLKTIVRYSNGDRFLEEGYYENGQIESKEEIIDYRRDGISIYYFKNGNIKSKGEYRKGKKIGLHEEFYSNGELKQKNNFIHVGSGTWTEVKKNGMQEFWDPRGTYRRECYADGEFVEIWNCDEEEKLKRERRIEQEKKDLLRKKEVAKDNLAKAIIEARNLDSIEIKIKKIHRPYGHIYIDIARKGCQKLVNLELGVELVLINNEIIKASSSIREYGCRRGVNVAFTRLINEDDHLILENAMNSIGIEKNTMHDFQKVFKAINFEVLSADKHQCFKKEDLDISTDLKKLCWYEYPPLDDKDTLNKHITFSWINE